MGSIQDRNGMDPTEAEDIQKRWQEYTEDPYKNDLHDPDNHDGVIPDLEPDILIIWVMKIFFVQVESSCVLNEQSSCNFPLRIS